MSRARFGQQNPMGARHADQIVRQARELRDKGHGYVTIAKRLGVPRGTIVQWVNWVTRQSA